LHAMLRFSHATLLARFFGVVIRIGVCSLQNVCDLYLLTLYQNTIIYI
jgi:hypothetical protein